MSRSRGFTLIEIMVVLVIMTVFLAIVILGFERIESRRVQQQADELTIWLKYVADSAIFDGVVYGVDLSPDTLQAYGYSRGQWGQSLTMEKFIFKAPIAIEFQLGQDASLIATADKNDKIDVAVMPELVFMPGGIVEPKGSFVISAKQQDSINIYWNDSGMLESQVIND
jgi:type II secretion system protein H